MINFNLLLEQIVIVWYFNLLLEQIVRKYMYVCNIAIQLISCSLPSSNQTVEFKSFLIYYTVINKL